MTVFFFWNNKGIEFINVSWPGRDGDPETLRESEDFKESLRDLRLTRVVEHYAKLIALQCESPPVLIGHSMGGLVVQLLLQKGIGVAGVALNTAPPKGVFVVSWSFVKGNFTMINPLRSPRDFHTPSIDEFGYNFLSDDSAEGLEERTRIFKKYVLQESRQVPRDSQGEDGTIDPAKKTAPLLITGGSLDHIVPSSVCKATHAKYASHAKGSKTDFVEFAGKTHWSILQSLEVIDGVFLWLRINLKA